MNTQGGTIRLKGYSTNWNFSALRLNLAGRDAAQSEETFTKDALWLVDQLIKPAWVVGVRVVIK